MWFQYIAIPLISAGIGWITNVIAIRLLFRPIKPFRLPLLNYEIQGLIPRRQPELAKKIGEVIEQELLSIDDVLDRFNTPEMQKKVALLISTIVVGRLQASIPSFVPASITKLIGDSAQSVLNREAPRLVEGMTDQIGEYLRTKVSFGEIVEEKILGFQLADLENLVVSVAQRELRQIEWLGGVLGLLIGLFQVGILYIFR